LPLAAIQAIVSGAVPVLVTVTVFAALVVFNSCPAKVRLAGDTLTAGLPLTTLNVAVTLLAAFIVTVQEPVPLQAPLHPAKDEPEAADALSATDAPEL